MKVEVKEVGGVQEISQEIMNGRIIIAPTAGRLLQNPFFRAPGPLHHMLVIRGVDTGREVFYANDPGTSRGKNLAYKQTTLFNAIHDWNDGDVLKGKKPVIVVGK